MNSLLKLAQPFFPKQLPKLPSVGANTPKPVGVGASNTPKPAGGGASNTPKPAVGGASNTSNPAVGGASNTPKTGGNLSALEKQFQDAYNRHYGPGGGASKSPNPADPASWTFGGKRDIDRFRDVSMSDLQKKS